MRVHRRTFAAAFAASVLAPAGVLAQETYPSRPVRMLIPYSAGTGPDTLARSIVQPAIAALGGAVFFDNKPAVGGNLALEELSKAPANGYTVGIATNSLAIHPGLLKLRFDPLKDFEPIGLVARSGLVLVTRATMTAPDMKGFVATSKAQPKQLTYSSPGSGSPQHLAMALMQHVTDTELLHVPYKGSGPAVTAVLAGEVDCMFMPTHTAAPFVREKRVKALLVSGKERSALMPEVPTAAEVGVRGLDVDLWYALLAPAGTPQDIVKAIQSQVAAVLRNPTIAADLRQRGLEPGLLPDREFMTLLRSDMHRWAGVIKRSGIVAD